MIDKFMPSFFVFYSCLRASMGFKLAALFAEYMPKNNPPINEIEHIKKLLCKN